MDIIELIKKKEENYNQLKSLKKQDKDYRLKIWEWLKSHEYWAEWIAHFSGVLPDASRKVADMNFLPKDFDIWVDDTRFCLDLLKPEDPRKGWIYIEDAPLSALADDEIDRIGKEWYQSNQEWLKEEIDGLDDNIKYHQDKIAENEKKKTELMKYVKDVEK